MYSPDKILSVCFYYLPFSDSLSVLQDLEISHVYSSVLLLSAFIKSASSLRKNLVFHSMYKVWSWSCLDPGTATDHLQLCMCCREHKVTVLGHSVRCPHAGRDSGHTLGSRQSWILKWRIILGKKIMGGTEKDLGGAS